MTHRKRVEWARLDNASKIFPAVRSSKDTKVFRLSCELTEDVDEALLQHALDLTMESFPLFRSVLRRGVFWYYLEISELVPSVEKESHPICAPIYLGDRRNLLFRVFYFHNRISIEVFHALTDGAGAVTFLQSLVYEYLLLKQREEFSGAIPKLDFKSPVSSKMDDSFEKHFTGITEPGQGDDDWTRPGGERAYQIKGVKLGENRTKLIEGSMSVRSLLDLSHKYNTSLTIFLASLLLCSIHEEMPHKKKNRPVVLSVPVDLRQFFKSATTRNFFFTMKVGYHFKDGAYDFHDVIDTVSKAFADNLTEEYLRGRLDKLVSLERNPFIRLIPLPLKDLVLRIAAKIKDGGFSSSISNLGRISMPAGLEPFIRQFSVCVSAPRPQVTMCSYQDRAVISFTSPFRETDIQRVFFRFLAKQGIEIEISSND